MKKLKPFSLIPFWRVSPEGYFYTRIFPWFVCSLAAFFYGYEFFLRVAPSVMTRDLMQAYHVNATEIGFLAAFYYFAYTPMQLPVGLLMDRYGPRRLLTFAIGLCTFGSFLFASLVYFYAALVGQLLMGLGSAFAFVGVMKLAANWLPANRFALVAGIATTLGMIGAMAGDSIIALFQFLGDWQIIWVYCTVFGVFLLLMMWIFVRDEPKTFKPGRPVRHEYNDWRHMFLELKHIILEGQFWINGLMGGLLFLPLTILGASWGVMFLEQGYGMHADKAGTIISMIFLGMAVGGPIMGWLSDYIGQRVILLRIGSFVSIILSVILICSSHLTPWMLGSILFMLGVSVSAEILVFAIGHELAEDKAAGTAVAGTNCLVMLGGMIVPPIVGRILDHSWAGQSVHGVQVFSLHDYQLGLSVIPIGLVLAFILSLCLKETHCRSQRH